MTQEIGPFTVGEVPPPLQYQFLDANGDPLNFTGSFTAIFQWGRKISGSYEVDEATAVIITPAEGRVQYSWTGNEFLIPGDYRGIFWVGDTQLRFASENIEWTACIGLGSTPEV